MDRAGEGAGEAACCYSCLGLDRNSGVWLVFQLEPQSSLFDLVFLLFLVFHLVSPLPMAVCFLVVFHLVEFYTSPEVETIAKRPAPLSTLTPHIEPTLIVAQQSRPRHFDMIALPPRKTLPRTLHDTKNNTTLITIPSILQRQIAHSCIVAR